MPRGASSSAARGRPVRESGPWSASMCRPASKTTGAPICPRARESSSSVRCTTGTCSCCWNTSAAIHRMGSFTRTRSTISVSASTSTSTDRSASGPGLSAAPLRRLLPRGPSCPGIYLTRRLLHAGGRALLLVLAQLAFRAEHLAAVNAFVHVHWGSSSTVILHRELDRDAVALSHALKRRGREVQQHTPLSGLDVELPLVRVHTRDLAFHRQTASAKGSARWPGPLRGSWHPPPFA